MKPLFEQQQALKDWSRFQRVLQDVPFVTGTLDQWDDPQLAENYLLSYRNSRLKLLATQPGITSTDKLETHCFFATDGTKHLVSRLHAHAHDRVSELRFRRDGQLLRLSYERKGGERQNLDELFRLGLLGIENDTTRFARYPDYVLRVLLFIPQGYALKSVYRGVGFYDQESHSVVIEEQGEGTC